MRKLFTLAFILAVGVWNAPAQAETYYDRVIREKREAAAVKRAQSIQRVTEVQADPEAYYARKSYSSARTSVEKFKVSRDGHYYVPVRVNNGSLTFLADTGATGIFISQSDAKKVGINPQTLQYNINYVTANGAKGRAAGAVAKKLKVGSIEMRDVPVIVSRENKHTALLGMEFFSRLKRYEVSNGEMSLYE